MTRATDGKAFGVKTPTPEAKQLQQAYDDGVKEGRKLGWVDALDVLHDDYMVSGVDTESPEGQAILTVTRRVAEKMRENIKK